MGEGGGAKTDRDVREDERGRANRVRCVSARRERDTHTETQRDRERERERERQRERETA